MGYHDRHHDWFAQNVLPHYPRLLLFAIRLVGPDRAGDLLQEACCRAWKSVRGAQHEHDLPAKPLGWMMQIIRHTGCKEQGRAARLRPVPLDQDIAAPQGPTPLDLLVLREQYAEVNQAILELPPRDQVALRMVADGTPREQIEATLDCRGSTCRMIIHRARRRLRRAGP